MVSALCLDRLVRERTGEGTRFRGHVRRERAVLTNGGNERDDEFAAAAHFGVHCAQLCVLPDDASILLVHADRLLDYVRLTCVSASMTLMSTKESWR